MKNKIKYLNLYQKEYSAFRALERLPKKILQQMGYLGGLDMRHDNKNKNELAKGIYHCLGGFTPVNFNEW
jgi:hypothetical protein